MSSTSTRTWDGMHRFGATLQAMHDDGIPVNLTYGSPIYLGQYTVCHAAIDVEMARIKASGRSDPLLVDWGAGVGHCAFVRSAMGDRVCVHSLEDAEAAPYIHVLRETCARAGIELRATAEPVSLPFGDGEVDVLVSCGVLEHVHEGGGTVEGSIAEITRVLRPGGAFVCAHLPQSTSWIETVNQKAGRSHHSKRFSRKEVVEIAARSGLEFSAMDRRVGVGTAPLGRYGLVPRIQLAQLFGRHGRDSARVGARLDMWDKRTSRLLPALAQNFVFVLRKPAAQ